MSTTHTPGPWTYHAKLTPSENHRGFRVMSTFGMNYCVADVMPMDPDGIRGEPNARLIAAAPELLAALQNLVPSAESMGWNTEKARAAIAKATGTA